VQPNNNADYYTCYLPVTEIVAGRGRPNKKQSTLLHKRRLPDNAFRFPICCSREADSYSDNKDRGRQQGCKFRGMQVH
jgi:hypothetical protein